MVAEAATRGEDGVVAEAASLAWRGVVAQDAVAWSLRSDVAGFEPNGQRITSNSCRL